MRSRLVVIAAVAAACGGDPGVQYELQLVPGARARNEASSVAVSLAGAGDTLDFRFALPAPTPAPPWRLALDTHRWGQRDFSVSASALAGTDAVAGGSAQARDFPAGAPIVVDLVDLPPAGDDGGVVDLSLADLTLPPDLSCPAQVLQLSSDADTVIFASLPNQFAGTGVIMNLGMRTGTGALDSIGLVRFDVSGLPPGAAVQSMRLTLTPAALSKACGNFTACVDCLAINHAGGFAVRFVDSGWIENSATYSTMMTAVRSNVLVNAPYSGVGALVADIPPSANSDFALFSAGGKISFQLDAFSLGQIVAATKENPPEGCGSYAVPSLQITYCP